TKTVLVIEDNELNMKLFHDLLRTRGHTVLQAREGTAGFELARQHRPDLILMDIQLPGVSGLVVAGWIKEDAELKSIPIIAVTAMAMKGDEDRIRQGGCDTYMAKPISAPIFLKTVDQFLRWPAPPRPMGSWGAGLYSGDFAADLRGAVKAVARLPFEPDRLVEILRESEPGAANNPDDEDHTTFWLVVADQFAKRSIDCRSVRDRALAIIDEGRGPALLAKLGMDAPGLAKRRKQLAELRARLAAPVAAKPRAVLKQPQAYVFAVGDLVIYPASGGKCINPYFPSKDKIPEWQQDGWGA